MADERPRRPLKSLNQEWNTEPDTPSERTLRDYLLGWATPQSDAIDATILADGASPMLDVIEDELIEEYITGEMSDADRPRFERRFLSSKQRLEKIRLSAMLLGRRDVAEGLSQRVASLRQEPRGT